MKCSRCRRTTRNAGGVCKSCLDVIDKNTRNQELVESGMACGYCQQKMVEERWAKGRLACKVCFNELVHGTIINCNTTFFGGSPATRDDISPYQENAIRNMEDM